MFTARILFLSPFSEVWPFGFKFQLQFFFFLWASFSLFVVSCGSPWLKRKRRKSALCAVCRFVCDATPFLCSSRKLRGSLTKNNIRNNQRDIVKQTFNSYFVVCISKTKILTCVLRFFTTQNSRFPNSQEQVKKHSSKITHEDYGLHLQPEPGWLASSFMVECYDHAVFPEGEQPCPGLSFLTTTIVDSPSREA